MLARHVIQNAIRIYSPLNQPPGPVHALTATGKHRNDTNRVMNRPAVSTPPSARRGYDSNNIESGGCGAGYRR